MMFYLGAVVGALVGVTTMCILVVCAEDDRRNGRK